jgi:hypothetical protein
MLMFMQTGSKGHRDGELLFPWGVALGKHTGNDITADKSSLLFVGDTNNNRIAVFNVVRVWFCVCPPLAQASHKPDICQHTTCFVLRHTLCVVLHCESVDLPLFARLLSPE